MDILRRFKAFVIRSEIDSNTVPVYYLGHTYTAEATSDELKRAACILTSKNKKRSDKPLSPVSSINFEGDKIVLRNDKKNNCCEFDARRIVVSCVDAKNQRLLAIFYHNDSPCIAGPITARGLECHLFLCKTKDIAKQAANHIGELLNEKYNVIKSRPPTHINTKPTDEEEVKLRDNKKRINIEDNQIRYSISEYKDQDLDYENINNFFRQKVLKISTDQSFISTPSDSLVTFTTTTGYDSGRGSTSPSIDLKNDDITFHRSPLSPNDKHITDHTFINPIRAHKNRSLTLSNSLKLPVVNQKNDLLTSEVQPKKTYSLTKNEISNNNRRSFGALDDMLSDSMEVYSVGQGELTKLLELAETDI